MDKCPKCGAAAWKTIPDSINPFRYFVCGSNGYQNEPLNQNYRCRIKELESENAQLRRNAAAWDWCERTGYFPSENRWLARPDNPDRLATCKRTWKLMDCRRFDTPLEAVEHAMKEATDAEKT